MDKLILNLSRFGNWVTRVNDFFSLTLGTSFIPLKYLWEYDHGFHVMYYLILKIALETPVVQSPFAIGITFQSWWSNLDKKYGEESVLDLNSVSHIRNSRPATIIYWQFWVWSYMAAVMLFVNIQWCRVGWSKTYMAAVRSFVNIQCYKAGWSNFFLYLGQE
jgi:hypothetical protein